MEIINFFSLSYYCHLFFYSLVQVALIVIIGDFRFLRLVQHTLQEIYLMEILVNSITICILVYFMSMVRMLVN
jgi:hypothetical protein